ncbi:MAG: hypothetical protein ACE5ES_05340, partial [Candidatus Nanoarchaeia archaeon]
ETYKHVEIFKREKLSFRDSDEATDHPTIRFLEERGLIQTMITTISRDPTVYRGPRDLPSDIEVHHYTFTSRGGIFKKLASCS